MNRNFIFLCLFVSTFFLACTKSDTRDAMVSGLPGTWQMVLVRNHSINTTFTKPSSIKGDVQITFSYTNYPDGIIEGVTPTNTLTAQYTTGPNETLMISSVSATKVMETSWGSAFLDNIRSSERYHIVDNGTLHISTPDKTLTFRRL